MAVAIGYELDVAGALVFLKEVVVRCTFCYSDAKKQVNGLKSKR